MKILEIKLETETLINKERAKQKCSLTKKADHELDVNPKKFKDVIPCRMSNFTHYFIMNDIKNS